MSKQKSKVTEVIKQVKIQRGLDRKLFFESGGELAQWRGVHTIRKNKKREKSRKACRGRSHG